MKIEFLGTGGSVPTPRPLCRCAVCIEARKRGVPFSRGGPSLFVHGPNLLVDTPEDISISLNRSTVQEISGVFLSHWHPDHVMGRRIFEQLGKDYTGVPVKNRCTEIFLTSRVIEDLKRHLGTWDDLMFYESQGLTKVTVIDPGGSFSLNGFSITPFQLSEDFAFGLQIEGNDKRIIIIPDETFQWCVPEGLRRPDVAVIPAGIFHIHPLTGAPHIAVTHPVMQNEITHEATLGLCEELNASITILTHIDEPDGCSVTQLKEVEERYLKAGRKIYFAFDTLTYDAASGVFGSGSGAPK